MQQLQTERLILRNWREDDRTLFHEINSDPQVMHFFPATRDRAQSNALMDELMADIEADGYGFAAVELRATGECLGFCGLSMVGPELPFGLEMIETGWRFAVRHWGKGYATEAARAWLDHGFRAMNLEEIVAFAIPANRRSTAVMDRLGMTHVPERDFDHPKVPDEKQHLRRHVLYAISRGTWMRGNGGTA